MQSLTTYQHDSADAGADGRFVGALQAFTAPWPGPGNSEGPPNGATKTVSVLARMEEWPDGGGLLSTEPWPGPGDSEGPASEWA